MKSSLKSSPPPSRPRSAAASVVAEDEVSHDVDMDLEEALEEIARLKKKVDHLQTTIKDTRASHLREAIRMNEEINLLRKNPERVPDQVSFFKDGEMQVVQEEFQEALKQRDAQLEELQALLHFHKERAGTYRELAAARMSMFHRAQKLAWSACGRAGFSSVEEFATTLRPDEIETADVKELLAVVDEEAGKILRVKMEDNLQRFLDSGVWQEFVGASDNADEVLALMASKLPAAKADREEVPEERQERKPTRKRAGGVKFTEEEPGEGKAEGEASPEAPGASATAADHGAGRGVTSWLNLSRKAKTEHESKTHEGPAQSFLNLLKRLTGRGRPTASTEETGDETPPLPKKDSATKTDRWKWTRSMSRMLLGKESKEQLDEEEDIPRTVCVDRGTSPIPMLWTSGDRGQSFASQLPASASFAEIQRSTVSLDNPEAMQSSELDGELGVFAQLRQTSPAASSAFTKPKAHEVRTKSTALTPMSLNGARQIALGKGAHSEPLMGADAHKRVEVLDQAGLMLPNKATNLVHVSNQKTFLHLKSGALPKAKGASAALKLPSLAG